MYHGANLQFNSQSPFFPSIFVLYQYTTYCSTQVSFCKLFSQLHLITGLLFRDMLERIKASLFDVHSHLAYVETKLCVTLFVLIITVHDLLIVCGILQIINSNFVIAQTRVIINIIIYSEYKFLHHFI